MSGGGPDARRSSTSLLNETVLQALGELHLRSSSSACRHSSSPGSRPCHRVPYRETYRARRRVITCTRSRPVGLVSTERCTCASSRCRAAGGFEFVDARQGRHHSSSNTSLRSRRAYARCYRPGPWPDSRCRTCASWSMTVSTTVDSKEVAFITAGRKAFLDAISNAQPYRARADRQRGGDVPRREDRRHRRRSCRRRRGQVTGTAGE